MTGGHPDGLPTLFLDRSLGRRQVPDLLRAAGLRLYTLAEVYGFPANGRQAHMEVLREYMKHGPRAELGRYELPFTPVDREAEMTAAHEELTRTPSVRPHGAASPTSPARSW